MCQQAFECELTEIRPSSVKCPDSSWTREANTVFTNMVLGKVFLAQVIAEKGLVLDIC